MHSPVSTSPTSLQAQPGPVRDWAGFAFKHTTRLWWTVTLAAQLLFAVTIAAFYGRAAARGDIAAWNRYMQHGYDRGDAFGNTLVAIHLLMALLVIIGGALQLSTTLRARAPRFHHWLGRSYIAAAYLISLSGLYMMWVRGTIGGLAQHMGMTILALIIMFCATRAIQAAMARNFVLHRQWALRLYLSMSTALFLRAGLFLAFLIPADYQEAYAIVVNYAQFVLPLTMLEVYLRISHQSGNARRYAIAASMLVLTLVMGGGLAVVTQANWLPQIRMAMANRPALTEQIDVTIRAEGVDAGIAQYRTYKANPATAADIKEGDINRLGYRLITAQKYQDAIRILQLNVDAYPQSGNAHDSLAEAYMLAGDKARAVAHYQQSLRLKPDNDNAVAMLKKLR
ncbi:DUF2306 domain-containing protein [Undibacterium sp. TS12]|uniref:DUF2306 domain-containing protein n=1 Tax=Undibacterium sp. TS12 TaxID=2908202 RepID=UPI001F4C9143|nr:DUF2306 domain-containing protein [Undibacterium sp. TS12]MCH8620521.1 DUF2306 domain-containing protein [Undibacterium sp. TS12]